MLYSAYSKADMAELVDAVDSKSTLGNRVLVRVRPSAHPRTLLHKRSVLYHRKLKTWISLMKTALHTLIFLIFLAPKIFAQDIKKSHEPLPLYYWDARPQHGFSNFGDALSEVLVERIIGRKVQVVTDPFNCPKKLLGMGSIMNYAQDDDVIWGTGVNGKASPHSYCFTTLDVRAVRGPLTRNFLLARGIECPEVYGDPTLLIPLYFPEFQKPDVPAYEYIIIPHFSDEYLFASLPNMVSAKEPWYIVIQKILNSKFVISSALSGVIVAEAFGIPARLLQIQNKLNTEDLFKYTDYYYGTNRFDFKYATSIEEALQMGGESLHTCDLQKLRNAFPFEYFQ